MTSAVDLVLFDAVGTLMFPDPPVAIAYERVGRKFGCETSAAEISGHFRHAFRTSYDPSHSGQPLRTSEAHELSRWQAIVGAVFCDAPISATEIIFPALWQHFAEPQHWRLFEDVQPVIEGLLARGYRVGIASNFDQRLLNICQAFPVLSQCEPIFISSQVGWSKPSPEYYRHIEQATGVSPDRILMIGDDEQNDVLQPRSLGWQARWLVREETAPGSDRLRTLTDLLTELA
ncbi:HAD-IA family hydrolase [Anatilimnocola sp. NA78]|uniref:HAD-IA family hydrolase n=1 Tax=Anatilimnocola sp. NA78 TaxID=3415683 RepID=UPI003CE50C2C